MTHEEKRFIRDIQKDTLFWIVRGLRTKTLSQEYVKNLASKTLDATRKATLSECFDALYELIEQFREVNDVFLKNARIYYFLLDQGKLISGRKFLGNNDYSNAVIALRGGGN